MDLIWAKIDDEMEARMAKNGQFTCNNSKNENDSDKRNTTNISKEKIRINDPIRFLG